MTTATMTKTAIDGKTLRRVVGQLRAAARRRFAPTPVTCIMIRPEDGHIHFEATDLALGLVLDVPAECSAGDAAVVPAWLLSELLKVVHGEVVLSVEGGHLVLTDELRTVRLNTIEAEEFPVVPVSDGLVWQDASWLLSMAPSLTMVASDDESRATLTGVRWAETELASTDTHRLCLRRPDSPMVDWHPVTVPAEALEKLPRLLDIRPGDKLEVAQSPNADPKYGPGNIYFRSGFGLVCSRLLEGQYPDYCKVLPTDPPVWQWTISSSEMIAALRSVAPIAARDKNRLTITRQGTELHFYSESVEFGSITVRLPLRSWGGDAGEDGEIITVNAHYILELLQMFPPQTEVIIGLYGRLSPLTFRSTDYASRLGVLMPQQARK